MARRPTWLDDIYDPVELSALLEPNKGRFTRKGDKRSDGEKEKFTAARHAQMDRDRAIDRAVAALLAEGAPTIFKKRAPNGATIRRVLVALQGGEWLAVPDVAALLEWRSSDAASVLARLWKSNRIARQPNPDYAADPLQPRYLYRINAAGREWLERNPA